MQKLLLLQLRTDNFELVWKFLLFIVIFVEHNYIDASPHNGIAVGCFGPGQYDHVSDGSVIAYNTIKIDDSKYPNSAGIGSYHMHGVDIHHNKFIGKGMEGIQIDHGHPGAGNRIKIRDNVLDIECKGWRGSATYPDGDPQPGYLQGVRLRYGVVRTDVYNNVIKVKATVSPVEDQNIAWGLFISSYGEGAGDFDDVKIWNNTVECVTDGNPTSWESPLGYDWPVGECYGIELNGLSSAGTFEMWDNTIKSNNMLFMMTDISDATSGGKIHDNVFELAETNFEGRTLKTGWGSWTSQNLDLILRNNRFTGAAKLDDIGFFGNYPSESILHEYDLKLLGETEKLEPIPGASIQIKSLGSNYIDQTFTTNAQGLVEQRLTNSRYRDPQADEENGSFYLEFNYQSYKYNITIPLERKRYLAFRLGTGVVDKDPLEGDDDEKNKGDGNKDNMMVVYIGIGVGVGLLVIPILIALVVILIVVIFFLVRDFRKKRKEGYRLSGNYKANNNYEMRKPQPQQRAPPRRDYGNKGGYRAPRRDYANKGGYNRF